MDVRQKKLIFALLLLDHVYEGCKKGTSCIPHCQHLRKRIDMLNSCSDPTCEACVHAMWLVNIHSKYTCKHPWKCKVPQCKAHDLAVEDLVNMGIDLTFLRNHFR